MTGLLSEINTKLAQGAYHETEGYIVFIVAMAALIAAHKLISLVANRRKKA